MREGGSKAFLHTNHLSENVFLRQPIHTRPKAKGSRGYIREVSSRHEAKKKQNPSLPVSCGGRIEGGGRCSRRPPAEGRAFVLRGQARCGGRWRGVTGWFGGVRALEHEQRVVLRRVGASWGPGWWPLRQRGARPASAERPGVSLVAGACGGACRPAEEAEGAGGVGRRGSAG